MKNNKKKPYSPVPKKALGGFSEYLQQNANGIGQGAGIAGSLIGAIDGADGSPSMGGGIFSGALSGAGAGAALGPLGMAGGAVLGAVTGIFKGNQAKKQARLEQKAKEEAMAQQRSSYSKAVLSSYATEGVQGVNYYAHGGKVTPTFEAEEGEVAQGNITMEEATPIASDMQAIEGESHEQGGTMGAGAGRIFSDRLNSISGKTFAAVAERLGKQKGKYELKVDSKHTPTKNTGKRMSENIEAKLDNLFIEQETMKAEQQSAFMKMALGGTTLGYDDPIFNPKTAGIGGIKAMQKQLGVKVDGDWGNISQKAYDAKFMNPLMTTDPMQGMAAPALELGPVAKVATPTAPVIPRSRFAQAIDGLGGIDGITAGVSKGVTAIAPFIDNIANSSLRTPNIPKPLLQNNVTLNKELNISPELANIDNTARAVNLANDANTSNSAVGRANRMSVFSRTLDAKNELMGRRSNYRNQQENTERMANSDIEARNNGLQNDYLMKDAMRTDDINRRTSQNVANLSMDIQSIARDKKLDTADLEKFKLGIQKNPDVLDNVLDYEHVLNQLSLKDVEAMRPSIKGEANIRHFEAIVAKKKKGTR